MSFLLQLSFSACSAEELKRISLVTENDWTQEKMSQTNLLTVRTLESMGYSVNMEYLPWARALKMVEEGKFDGVSGIFHTEDRAKKLSFSDAVIYTEIVLFKRVDRLQIFYDGTSTSLLPYLIGTVRGYTYGNEFDNANNIKKVPSVSPKLNLKMLLNKRVDLIIGSRLSIQFLLEQNYPKQAHLIQLVTKPLKTIPVYTAFSKQMSNVDIFVKSFNQALIKTKADLDINVVGNKPPPVVSL